jgi:hypothetical protein
VKAHLRERNITHVVIPGVMAPYLHAGDIGIYKPWKDIMSNIIAHWKKSDEERLDGHRPVRSRWGGPASGYDNVGI